MFVPSTEDITNMYPIPQPAYSHNLVLEDKKLHYTSNPGIMNLHGAKQVYSFNLINYDLLQYIDENRTGRASN